jgi:hypothetical protein
VEVTEAVAMGVALVAVVTEWAAMLSMAVSSAVALAFLRAHSMMITRGGVGGALVTIGGCATDTGTARKRRGFGSAVYTKRPKPTAPTARR